MRPGNDDGVHIIETLGRTRDGGSCAECDRGYLGDYGDRKRGYRVIAVHNFGDKDLFHLCPDCYESNTESRL
jgi:hypothetical protein